MSCMWLRLIGAGAGREKPHQPLRGGSTGLVPGRPGTEFELMYAQWSSESPSSDLRRRVPCTVCTTTASFTRPRDRRRGHVTRGARLIEATLESTLWESESEYLPSRRLRPAGLGRQSSSWTHPRRSGHRSCLCSHLLAVGAPRAGTKDRCTRWRQRPESHLRHSRCPGEAFRWRPHVTTGPAHRRDRRPSNPRPRLAWPPVRTRPPTAPSAFARFSAARFNDPISVGASGRSWSAAPGSSVWPASPSHRRREARSAER